MDEEKDCVVLAQLIRVTTFGTANGMRFPTSLKGQGYRYTP